MIDRFFVGCITGIMLAAILAIDTQWYISIPIATGIYTIGYIIANKLRIKDE